MSKRSERQEPVRSHAVRSPALICAFFGAMVISACGGDDSANPSGTRSSGSAGTSSGASGSMGTYGSSGSTGASVSSGFTGSGAAGSFGAAGTGGSAVTGGAGGSSDSGDAAGAAGKGGAAGNGGPTGMSGAGGSGGVDGGADAAGAAGAGSDGTDPDASNSLDGGMGGSSPGGSEDSAATGGTADSGSSSDADSGPNSGVDSGLSGDADAGSSNAADAGSNQCADGVKDGLETHVDCGGGICPPCAVGKMCLINADCVSLGCDVTTLTCDANQCHDGIKDGTETDVDCGGSICPLCAAGKMCLINADCSPGICDLSGTATNGQCVPTGNIVYVDSSSDSGQTTCSLANKDGSQAYPYCQIAEALALISILPTKTYVHLAGSANLYDQFELTSTSSTLTFVGPGKSAPTTATIRPALNAIAINIDPASPSSASVVLSGLSVVGNGTVSALSCNGSGGSTPQLTIIDSSFSGGTNALSIRACAASVRTSTFSNASQIGLDLGPSSTYSIQNCFVFGNATGVRFQSGSSGKFSFNTVAYNTGTIGVACDGSATLEASIVFGNKQSAGSQFTGTSCALMNVVTGTDSYSGAIQSSPALIATNNLHLDTTAGAARTTNRTCCVDKINGPPPLPLPTIDIDNEARPKGASWDIGADEGL
jgi:hypothetical protein